MMKQLALAVILILGFIRVSTGEVLKNTALFDGRYQKKSDGFMLDTLLQADQIIISAEPSTVLCTPSSQFYCQTQSQLRWQKRVLTALIARLNREQWIKHFIGGVGGVTGRSDVSDSFVSYLSRSLFINLFREGVDFRPGWSEFKPSISGTEQLTGFDYLRNKEVKKAKEEDFQRYYGTEERKKIRIEYLKSVLGSAFYSVLGDMGEAHPDGKDKKSTLNRVLNAHFEKSEAIAWRGRKPGSLVFLTSWNYAHSAKGAAPYIRRFSSNFIRSPKVVVIRLVFSDHVRSIGSDGFDFLLIEEVDQKIKGSPKTAF